MRRLGRLGILGLIVGGLLLAIGCGKKGETGPEDKTASINGGAAGGNASGSPGSANSRDSGSPKTASDPRRPVVEIQTTMGNILVELDAGRARATVDNFLYYVENAHYDGTIFHQVLKGYVVMGGQYLANLSERRCRTAVHNEARKCGLMNVRGAIAMVRKPDVIDSATCQFFINVADNPNLDYKGESPEEYGYCPFGKVIEGQDIVDRIADVPVKDEGDLERLPVQTVGIKSIRRVR